MLFFNMFSISFTLSKIGEPISIETQSCSDTPAGSPAVITGVAPALTWLSAEVSKLSVMGSSSKGKVKD